MRTIDEIKEGICAEYMRNDAAAAAYGFVAGANFADHFSKVSVENILFYAVAVAVWILENLFEAHKTEVETRIEAILPHRPKWYRDKVLGFMQDRELLPDTDRYDTSGMSDAEIAAAHVVKHAVAMENQDASMLTIKVAGDKDGKRAPLAAAVKAQLAVYIGRIKDAGVRINLVNAEPDVFNCEIDVYYNPMLTPDAVEQACRKAIRGYLENLPFNGEYTNMALVDTLQAVEGVVIPEFKSAATAVSGDGIFTAIDARCIPVAGYFVEGNIQINMRAYE